MTGNTHHVPEGCAGALAGRVVLQDGGVVDQFTHVVAAIKKRQQSNQSNTIAATANP